LRKPWRLADATPAALLPDDPIKAAARYTTKYLIFHLGAYPATPNASAHIVAPHTALGLRIRDTPIAALSLSGHLDKHAARPSRSPSENVASWAVASVVVVAVI
jgi:hypothetical protein